MGMLAIMNYYRLLSLLLLAQVAESRRLPSIWGFAGRNVASTSQTTCTLATSLQRGGYQNDEILTQQSDIEQKQPATEEIQTTTPQQQQLETEESLDDKVRRAMEKLGLTPPPSDEDPASPDTAANCEGGVCTVPPPTQSEQDPEKLADQIASSMNIDRSLAMAAIAATATNQGGNTHVFNEVAARQMILQELQVISTVPEDSENVQKLVQEGSTVFEARRALAFAEGDMDNARAILLAEREDVEHEEAAQQEQQPEPVEMKTVEVKSDFDPTKFAQAEPQQESTPPKPADKSKVVFEATSQQIQELVLESPVPVLLDIHAEWCQPCKVLGPALEEMAIKSGGAFRLVKVNTDNERPVSAALEVTSLPSVFGVKNGKIVNMFQGMPRSQEAMKSFMMGLMVSESHFSPPVTEEQKEQFAELTSKLVKMAGSACFSFAAREQLQDRITAQLDKLVQETGDFSIADESTQILKSLMVNIIRDPYSAKFRSVKLDNKVIAAKVKQFPACLAILKTVGFSAVSDTELALHKKKPMINVAPLIVARDTIDKWVEASRYEVAKAARKRKDEVDRIKVQKELEEAKANAPEDEEEDVEAEIDPDACVIKARIEGKKKVHDLNLRADDTLATILSTLPISIPDERHVKITCAAKRLIVNATDGKAMQQTLRQLGLHPSASIVVAIGSDDASSSNKKSSKAGIKERAAKKKKKGSHTMQSIGIYAKDDNAKGELIDGGGGVMYEQDVSDDEEEKPEEQQALEADDKQAATDDDVGEAEGDEE